LKSELFAFRRWT